MISEFFQNYNFIIDIISYILYFIISIMLFVKTKSIKHLEDFMKDLKTGIIHRTDNDVTDVKQRFSNMQNEYRLNQVTNELEKTESKIDLQALTNSSKETALDRVLDRFLPDTTPSQEVAVYDALVEDLDFMTEAINTANNYRDKFGLSVEMSVQDVFAFVKKESETLKTKIEQAQKPKEEEKNG